MHEPAAAAVASNFPAFLYPSDNYDPSAPSNFDRFGWTGRENDDALQTCFAREIYTPPASSISPESESADSVHGDSGALLSAQHDNFPGYTPFYTNNLPQSPIPDSIHPWDEPQQPRCLVSVETPATSQDNSASHHSCFICNKSFVTDCHLKRHLETTHKHGKDYWICTVKSCRKYCVPNFRKDNFRRHCRRKHPTVDLKEFGL
ncbi:hypothetical protein PG993_005978 [Apiospora rasikravindrae]|uniref:C2H2-type domain-containing protein n=1 Tax=Apiospora rasikravindrae TaxID=990691 RepID=A0ABR1TCZ8_9PEZI